MTSGGPASLMCAGVGCSLRFASCFFEWSAAHRNLHSFPTRRSSDLHDVGRYPGRERLQELALRGVCGASIDRKSTRLNSSHTVTSYAVFCLKKNIDSHQP